MPMDPELLELMPHTVTVARRIGKDKFGEAEFAPAVPYPAQVVERVKRVRDAAGEERISTVQAIVATDKAISPFDKITLPDGTSPKILAVGSYPDEAGLHTVEVYC